MIDFELARRRMVEEQLIPRGIKDERVLEAMRKVPRHLFLDRFLWDRAYGDYALPIVEGQTISQPYMVALMTETLELKGDERVLEIGTGSGYQTAILAELSAKVYSIDRIQSLVDRAIKILEELGYHNTVLKVCNGTHGWEEEGPFDAIMVTAGSPDMPSPLIRQLKDEGRMAIPVGGRYAQTLIKVIKRGDNIEARALTECVFVPLIGDFGWKEREV